MKNHSSHDEFQQALDRSMSITDELQRILGREASLDDRGRLAMAYLTLALEHREAILMLVTAGAYPSATALQRPLLEAFVAGVWILHSATEAHVEQMRQRKRPVSKFETMAKQLRESHPLGEWFEVFRSHYDILGDYAHGHHRQISRMMGPAGITSRYSATQLIEVLRHSDLVGIMAALHREDLAGRPIERLSEMMDALMDSEQHDKATEQAKGTEPSSET
jgi:hypothetical protein